MTATIDLERNLVEAAGRATVYSLLAAGFAFPTTERFDLITRVLLPAASILEVSDELGAAIQATSSSFSGDVDVARQHHFALFPPVASQDAPGYETGYRGDGVFQQSAIIADIAGFYRAHDLRAGGSERERPDHVTVELEFMAVVARKEALAIAADSQDNAFICGETSAKFLQDHLSCWASAFGLRVAAISPSPWYRSLGKLLAGWIAHDLSVLSVEPVEVAEIPLPQEPPDDGSCGPCPAGQSGSVL